jgi:hypothetical protein
VAELGPREQQQRLAIVGAQLGQRGGQARACSGGVETRGSIAVLVLQRIASRARVR